MSRIRIIAGRPVSVEERIDRLLGRPDEPHNGAALLGLLLVGLLCICVLHLAHV